MFAGGVRKQLPPRGAPWKHRFTRWLKVAIRKYLYDEGDMTQRMPCAGGRGDRYIIKVGAMYGCLEQLSLEIKVMLPTCCKWVHVVALQAHNPLYAGYHD